MCARNGERCAHGGEWARRALHRRSCSVCHTAITTSGATVALWSFRVPVTRPRAAYVPNPTEVVTKLFMNHTKKFHRGDALLLQFCSVRTLRLRNCKHLLLLLLQPAPVDQTSHSFPGNDVSAAIWGRGRAGNALSPRASPLSPPAFQDRIIVQPRPRTQLAPRPPFPPPPAHAPPPTPALHACALPRLGSTGAREGAEGHRHC